MKKYLALVLALVMGVMAFAACGKKTEETVTTGSEHTPICYGYKVELRSDNHAVVHEAWCTHLCGGTSAVIDESVGDVIADAYDIAEHVALCDMCFPTENYLSEFFGESPLK